MVLEDMNGDGAGLGVELGFFVVCDVICGWVLFLESLVIVFFLEGWGGIIRLFEIVLWYS